MLTFNDLLALEGIDTAKVRLVRHQDGRLGAGRLYESWRTDRDAFEDYQAIQARDVFPVGGLRASFVVTEASARPFSWACTGPTASAHARPGASTPFSSTTPRVCSGTT